MNHLYICPPGIIPTTRISVFLSNLFVLLLLFLVFPLLLILFRRLTETIPRFQVFSKAKVMFSIGGQFYNGKTLSYAYMPDLALENARNVSIHLLHRIARFIRLRLFFADRWIMLSEVFFESGKSFIGRERRQSRVIVMYGPEAEKK